MQEEMAMTIAGAILALAVLTFVVVCCLRGGGGD